MATPMVIAAQASSSTAEAAPVSRFGWYALAVMVLIFSCNFLDRAVLSLVAEPVRKEFGLSDSQLGVLNGFAFGLMFAVAGIPIGLLVDRVNRSRLLACMVFLWSGATAACGLAQSYVWLLIGRMAVGAAESGGAPTSYSLMSDYFPPRQRSTAVGFYYLGGAVGGLMCWLVGSRVAAHYGWRAALYVAAVPGITLAVLAFTTLREPKRGATEPALATPQAEQAVGLNTALRRSRRIEPLLYLFGAAPLNQRGRSRGRGVVAAVLHAQSWHGHRQGKPYPGARRRRLRRARLDARRRDCRPDRAHGRDTAHRVRRMHHVAGDSGAARRNALAGDWTGDRIHLRELRIDILPRCRCLSAACLP